MHDIKRLRSDPAYREALNRRTHLSVDWAAFDLLEEQRKSAQMAADALRAERNQVAELAAKAKKSGDHEAFSQATEAGRALHVRLDAGVALSAQLVAEQQQMVAGWPNVPHPDAPIGEDASHNKLVRQVGTPDETPGARDHVDVGREFGLNMEAASAMSGARFCVLEGDAAKLQRALTQLMLDTHGDHGYTEVYVPHLVLDTALYGTGQLPKFEEDLFRTQDGLYLIPTAEVPVTNLVAGALLGENDLPKRYVAHTPCFRREAGSAGRDVRGLIRQHQFEKVELVRIEMAQNADAALNVLVDDACRVLDLLELPYQVVELCTGDMGFGARRTYDIEVWLPSQGCYREISSCSTMGDFQARRMGARVKTADGAVAPLHTLNGSGVAVGRALVAVLENHIQPDGTLRIPAALQPYLGGRGVLEPRQKLTTGHRHKPA